ncbi:MAG TPA: PKD domain-containing protein, partial [Thermoplasmata archaeon]|nr:PKD domain-containing protein [Thermoplasmata archaeon]
GSVATPYSGGQANVTLLPGTYPAVLENGSTPTAAMNLSLSAGEYLSVGFPGLTISPAQAPGGTTGNASGELFVPGTTVWVNWTNGTNLCHATADSRGNFSCDFTVPAIAAGPYRLSASAGGAMPETAWQSLNVTTDLAVSLTAAQPATDVGIPLSFAASASGGYAPYGAFQWTFGDGTNLSGTNGSASHSYLRPGTFTVEVELRDRVGSLVRASVSVTIDATPTITLPSGSRASADVGQSVNFTATAALGSGLYTYMWSGLPAGCLPMAGVAVCEDLSVVGTSTVAVTVTDSFGAVVSSSALAFRTYADPTVELPTTDRMSADVGQPVAFRTNATLGSGNYSFAWVGLPSGCPGSGSAISCAWSAPGNVSVRVWATDSNGYTVGSGSVGLRIFPAPSLSTPNASRPSVDVGQSVTFSVTANGGSGGLHYAWASLPGGCDSSDSPTLVCVPTALGSAFVTVSVTDSNGVVATSMISYQTYADPTIGALRSSINATDVGVAFTLSSSAAGGSGNLTFVWTGLPTGCPGADASVVTCAATGPGRFSVVVSAVDPNGFAVTSAALEVVIAPAPTTTVVTDPSGALEGVALTIRAEVSGGTPGFHYAWRGLPSGCRASDAAAISCTPNATGTFAVTVAVTDAVGSTSNATLSVSIAPSFLGLPQWEGIGLVVAAAIAAAGAAIVLLRRRRAPPRGPGAAVAPPPSDPHPPTPP